MRRTIIVLLALIPSIGFAEKLTMDIACKGKNCTLSSQRTTDLATMTKKVAALKARIDSMKNNEGISDFTIVELQEVKKQVKQLQEAMSFMVGMMGQSVHVKELTTILSELMKQIQERLDFLVKLIFINHQQIKLLHDEQFKLNNLIYNTRNNLSISGFGLLASTYGTTEGALLTLELPTMEGKVVSRLTGGLGVSPTTNLAWLASFSVSRQWSWLSVGPIAMVVNDTGKDFSNSPANYIVAGGLDIRLKLYKSLFVSAVPFVGVSPSMTGSNWVAPEYKSTACGNLLIKDGHFSTQKQEMVVSVGGLLSLGFKLF